MTINNELAERLAVLIEVAASLPPSVALKLNETRWVCSLNLITVHYGTQPAVSTTVTVEDTNGVPMPRLKPIDRPSTKALATHLSDGAARVFYPRISDVERSYVRRCGICESWSGDTTYMGDIAIAAPTRAVVQFGHRRGSSPSQPDERVGARLVWTDVPCAADPHVVRLPIASESKTVLDAAEAVEDTWMELRAQEIRDAAEPHGAYRHIKLAALNALSDGRTTVTMSDWDVAHAINTRSGNLRDDALRAYGITLPTYYGADVSTLQPYGS